MQKICAVFLLAVLVLFGCEDPEPEVVTPASKDFDNSVQTAQIDAHYEIAGHKIAAPYRWLKDTNNPQVAEWMNQQRTQTKSYFDSASPLAAKTLEAIQVLSEQVQISHTLKHEYKYYYVEKPIFGDSISIKQYDSLAENTTPLIPLLPANIANIAQFKLQPAGRFVAFEVESSKKTYQWYIYDLVNQRYNDHQLAATDYSSNLIWLDRHRIISAANQQLTYHNLLKSNDFDYAVFDINEYIDEEESGESSVDGSSLNEEPQNNSNVSINGFLSFDKNYLLAQNKNVHQKGYQLWAYDLNLPEVKFEQLIDSEQANFTFLGNTENTFYFKTDLAAPRGRIISVNLEKPQRRYWKEVIAQSNAVLVSAKLINQKWLLEYSDNTRSQLKYARLNGNKVESISLDSLAKLSYSKEQTESDSLIIGLQTPFLAQTPKQLDLVKLEINALEPFVELSPTDTKREVAFYRSDDGSRIPISLIQRNKIVQDGKNKTLLLTHQGFGESFDYRFSPLIQQWLDTGNLIAIAHIRGGGSFGESWHKAGAGNNKTKALSDIEAAIEWLFDKGYSKKTNLAIFAEKHNSPLFAALINQKPNSISAAIFEQSYFDLLDNKHLQNSSWQKEFAYQESQQAVSKLLEWSPLQNLKQQAFPALLVTSNQAALPYLAKTQNLQQVKQPLLLLAPEPITEENQAQKNSSEQQLEAFKKVISFLENQT